MFRSFFKYLSKLVKSCRENRMGHPFENLSFVCGLTSWSPQTKWSARVACRRTAVHHANAFLKYGLGWLLPSPLLDWVNTELEYARFTPVNVTKSAYLACKNSLGTVFWKMEPLVWLQLNTICPIQIAAACICYPKLGSGWTVIFMIVCPISNLVKALSFW